MVKSYQPRACLPRKIGADIRRSGETGTALAIIDNIPSCGQSRARGAWGGARNSANRTSEQLTYRQCVDLIDAGNFADAIGLRFNRHWSVHYAKAGIAEHEAAGFIGRLLKLAGDFARRHKGQFAALWVREGGQGKGGHVHIVMHLPSRLTLKGRTRRWVGLAGGKCCNKVSKVRPIAGRVAAADGDSLHYRHNARNVKYYVLKNVSREAGEHLGLSYSGERGLVVGKRCGWTQNIGLKARKGL